MHAVLCVVSIPAIASTVVLTCLCCFLQFVGDKKPYKNISQLWDGEVEASANEE